MNDKEYKIQVSMTLSFHDNPTNPYFWCILEFNNGWSNTGSGWSKTPDEAFLDAKDYLLLPYEEKEASDG